MNFFTLLCRKFVFKVDFLHSKWPKYKWNNECIHEWTDKSKTALKKCWFCWFKNIKFHVHKVSNKMFTYCIIFAQQEVQGVGSKTNHNNCIILYLKCQNYFECHLILTSFFNTVQQTNEIFIILSVINSSRHRWLNIVWPSYLACLVSSSTFFLYKTSKTIMAQSSPRPFSLVSFWAAHFSCTRQAKW